MEDAVTKLGSGWSWAAFLALLPLQLWAAHATVFFLHEYAHATVAWLLGWKNSPFALDYAQPTLKVVLLQLGINQGVNEGPIFASGHGTDAAIIGAAGAVLGNGLVSLPLSRLAYRAALTRNRLGWASFAYWCTVASIGNFFDYVPIRTFTLESDMGSVRRGFGWSPWPIMVLFGLPTLAAMIWLLYRAMPRTLLQLLPRSIGQQLVAATATVVALFAFYGAAGLLEGGPISFRLSELSIGVVLPLILVFSVVRQLRLWRSRRPAKHRS